MERESNLTRSIIDELQYLDTRGDQVEEESAVTPSIIDELHSLDIQPD